MAVVAVAAATGASASPAPAPAAGLMVTGASADAHERGAGVELPGGDVLVCGGDRGGERGMCERWSSASGLWSPAPRLASARHDFVLVRLAGGTIAAVGGQDVGQPVLTVEVLPPGGARWSAAGALPAGVAALAAAQSRAGEIVVVGRRYLPQERAVVLTGALEPPRWAEHDVDLLLVPWVAAATPPAADGGFVFATTQYETVCHPPPIPGAAGTAASPMWLLAPAGRPARWSVTPQPVSEAVCALLAPGLRIAPAPLADPYRLWGAAVTVPLSAGGVLTVQPFPTAVGASLEAGLGWRLGGPPSPDPCQGAAALIESFAVPRSGELGLPASPALEPLGLAVSADCQRAYTARNAARLVAALSQARLPASSPPESPSPSSFAATGRAVADYVLCTLGAPFDGEHLAAVVLRPGAALEHPIATLARGRCLSVLARRGEAAAARTLATYATSVALRSALDERGTATSSVDPALVAALPTSPGLRATATEVLERALAHRAGGSDELRLALCGGTENAPAAPPICRRTPPSPERQWALAASRRIIVINLGFKVMFAALLMTGGVAWRRNGLGRLIVVLATIIGGAYSGVEVAAAGSRDVPCEGGLCGLADAMSEAVGGVAGGGVGLATGVALSFAGPGGMVAGTAVGVAALVGAAAHDAIGDWNEE
jgi:hypothetical protein